MLYAVGLGPCCVESADLDGDGDADLVTANEPSNTVSVLLNHRDGTFESYEAYGVTKPYAIVSADLDGDGDVDLATVNEQDHTVSVILNSCR